MSQDYSGQNLRGRSFRGKNLEGADFSYADIRGANFTGTNLRGANFTKAKAGLQEQWIVFMLLISCFFSSSIGLTSALSGYSIFYFFLPSGDQNIFLGLFFFITYIVLLFINQKKGIELTSKLLPAFIFVTGIFAIAGIGAVSISVAISIASNVVFVIVGSVIFAFIGAFGNKIHIIFFTIISIVSIIFFTINGTVSKYFTVAFTLALPNVEVSTGTTKIAYILTILGATITLSTSLIIAYQALNNNGKFNLIRTLALVLTTVVGTSFRGAELTETNFTRAILKNANFMSTSKKTILTRVCWKKVQKFNFALTDNNYLQNHRIRKLLITGSIQEQELKFDNLDLSGINLRDANLKYASFIGTNLNYANLQDSDLSRAILKQTQLDATDFTGATLTGACIEDWGITNETKFHGVRCEYVYMRLPTKENLDPWRKPDNREEVFADGEFGDFIKPLVDTLDLYHNQSVDPRAIAISFKELAENNPDAELEIVAMERRSKDKFLLRAKTAPDADKSQLSAEYFESYNQIKALAQQEVQALMLEKDSRIRSLENFVDTALKRPSFYSNTSVEKVDNMNNQPGGISQNMSGGTMHGGMQAAQGDHNKQTMDTNVVSPSQQQTLTEAAAEIQALLEQLEKSYPTDTTTGKIALAMEAITQIDSNPNLTARILSALKVGSVKAFEQFLNHPAASFVIGALEDWQTTKRN